MPKKTEPKKKAVKVEKSKGPCCAACQCPVDTSARSGDEGVPKARCMNEYCSEYGIPREVPSA